MMAMPQTFFAPPEFEPPYRLEVGGQVVYKSLPSYARAISLAGAWVKHGTRRKVEVFDSEHTQVFEAQLQG